MEMEDEQQQQQQRLHSIDTSILYGIVRLADRRYRDERHKLIVSVFFSAARMDRRSLQHLVHFLDNGDSHEVTELVLCHVFTLQPSDGGLEVLRSFFARSDTTLTKVRLESCNFGQAEDASQLLMAFQTNTTVTDLEIRDIAILQDAAFGNCLCDLLQNAPQLQRLDCSLCSLRVEGIRAFQPALQANRTLKELDLFACDIRDEGIHLIADGLVGNTTMESLDISSNYNGITSVGLADITRLLVSTQLKRIDLGYNRGMFNDEDAIQHFVTTLQRKKSRVQELPLINNDILPAVYASIKNSLIRNRQLNRVNLLLAPPPQQQQQQRNAGTMMLKLWHKAVTKFAMVPNNAGASAIFTLFQARPALLEMRIKRPASAAAVSQEQKRRRL
jgi:hypothetical protein